MPEFVQYGLMIDTRCICLPASKPHSICFPAGSCLLATEPALHTTQRICCMFAPASTVSMFNRVHHTDRKVSVDQTISTLLQMLPASKHCSRPLLCCHSNPDVIPASIYSAYSGAQSSTCYLLCLSRPLCRMCLIKTHKPSMPLCTKYLLCSPCQPHAVLCKLSWSQCWAWLRPDPLSLLLLTCQ